MAISEKNGQVPHYPPERLSFVVNGWKNRVSFYAAAAPLPALSKLQFTDDNFYLVPVIKTIVMVTRK